MRVLLVLILTTFFINADIDAQSDRRFVNSWVPTKWEIYNTTYDKRYWDNRDNYDYITFKSDKTFLRKYQGLTMSGTWTYDKKKKIMTLTITKPFKKTIKLKVKKVSGSNLVYKSSEEGYKVTMYMKKGAPPRRRMK